MGRKEHHEQIPGQNQNGHLRNPQILKTRLDLGFYSRTTNLSYTHTHTHICMYVCMYVCMYRGLGFIFLDARKKYTTHISWVYQITQEGENI